MLTKEYGQQGKAIEEAFSIIDDCIGLLNRKTPYDDFHWICGLALAKARNYALGAYELILDGLAQEAGALVRPFIEYHELLIYFRKNTSRVKEALEDRLPPAGKRAQEIGGCFHGFREYLNKHASHSSFSHHALNHLFEKPEMTIRKEQPMLPNALFRNISDFFVLMILLGIEAVNCLQTEEGSSAEAQAMALDELRRKGIDIFRLDERSNKDALKV